MMKKKIAFVLFGIFLLSSGFWLGLWYSKAFITLKVPSEDYVLTDIIDGVGDVHLLEQRRYEELRQILDIELERQLDNVKPGFVPELSDEAKVAKLRILNSVAGLWAQHPPFDPSPDFTCNPTLTTCDEVAKSFVDEIKKETERTRAKNMALLQWAKATCNANPKLDCDPYVKLPAETQGKMAPAEKESGTR
jgi:hypothetical protein